MSIASLHSFFTFREEAPPTEIVLQSLPLPDGVTGTDRGLVLAYGARRDMIPRAAAEADARGETLAPVTIAVDVGDILPGVIREEHLKLTRLLPLARLDQELRVRFLGTLGEVIKESRGGIAWEQPFEANNYLARNIDALAQVLLRDELYSNISVATFSTLDPETRGVLHYALLLRSQGIREIKKIGTPHPVRVKLPKVLLENNTDNVADFSKARAAAGR